MPTTRPHDVLRLPVASQGDEPHYREQLETLLVDADKLVNANDVGGYLENNRQFHDLIYQMAGNGRLSALASQLILPMYQLRLPERMHPGDMATSNEHHHAIANAILSCDPNAARTAMAAHLHWSGQGLMAVVSDTISERQRKGAQQKTLINHIIK